MRCAPLWRGSGRRRLLWGLWTVVRHARRETDWPKILPSHLVGRSSRRFELSLRNSLLVGATAVASADHPHDDARTERDQNGQKTEMGAKQCQIVHEKPPQVTRFMTHTTAAQVGFDSMRRNFTRIVAGITDAVEVRVGLHHAAAAQASHQDWFGLSGQVGDRHWRAIGQRQQVFPEAIARSLADQRAPSEHHRWWVWNPQTVVAPIPFTVSVHVVVDPWPHEWRRLARTLPLVVDRRLTKKWNVTQHHDGDRDEGNTHEQTHLLIIVHEKPPQITRLMASTPRGKSAYLGKNQRPTIPQKRHFVNPAHPLTIVK